MKKKMWIHKNEINKMVPEYDYYYVYAPQGYTRGRSKYTRLHLNDKVEVKIKGKWHRAILHDIFDTCWIVLCERYMSGNTNMVKVENRNEIRKVS